MILFSINAKQRKTYERIFEDPINGSIEWKDIENMLLSLGAEITEGSGSRVRIKLNGERAVFHRHLIRRGLSIRVH